MEKKLTNFFILNLFLERNISNTIKLRGENVKKKSLLYILIAIILIVAMGCQKDTVETDVVEMDTVDEDVVDTDPINVKFYYQDGTPALTVAKLASENPIIDEMVTIDYEMQNAPDLLVASILKEEADIAIVPSNLAAQAFNKDLSYKILGTSTWGTMYLASSEDINGFEELKGKEIYTFGKGLTPDLVLRYVLANNDIDPDEDVEIVYLNSAQEMGPAFLSGKTDLAVLPEPLLSTVMIKKEDVKILYDLNEEWSKISGAEKGFPQASLIIKEDLIENNSDFVDAFIKEYEASRLWAAENPAELAEYAEELEIGVAKEIIESGIRWTNPESFKIGDNLEEYKVYYQAIIDFAPDFIGGKIPGEELYYKE